MFTVLSDEDVAVVEDVIPEVIETVTVRRAPQRPEADIWDAEQLLVYVASEIQQVHGPFPRDPKKESGIMRSFVSRWGDQAGPIAQYAFEVAKGMWRNAPISITRFCKGSDPYFAQVIAEQL